MSRSDGIPFDLPYFNFLIIYYIIYYILYIIYYILYIIYYILYIIYYILYIIYYILYIIYIIFLILYYLLHIFYIRYFFSFIFSILYNILYCIILYSLRIEIPMNHTVSCSFFEDIVFCPQNYILDPSVSQCRSHHRERWSLTGRIVIIDAPGQCPGGP